MPGWLAFGFLAGVVLVALGGLLVQAPSIETGARQDLEEITRVVRYTLLQAGLSTLLSILLAIPLARALSRRRAFWGRTLLIRLSSISLVIPTMVAVFGIAAVHGRSGWMNQGLGWAGFEQGYTIYGLAGILLAHLFFNLPLATRVFLNTIDALPGETWRLVSQLGLKPGAIFRLVEWPLLRSVIPGIAGLIFMLCFTSFAIVLALGGGPRWSTLEVAIYQAIRFDFDISRGVILALIQIAICLSLVLLFNMSRRSFSFQATPGITVQRPDVDHRGTRLLDAMVIFAALVFLLSPLLAVLTRALNSSFVEVVFAEVFLQALVSSLIISLAAASLALLLALPIAFLHKNLLERSAVRRIVLLEAGHALILVVPPLTLGMGLFLLLRDHFSVFDLGLYLVILINGMLAVPFLLRVLQPAVSSAAQQVDRLSLSLGVHGWTLFRLVYWPHIRRASGFAMALAATLSLGDMGVIALFGTQDLATLPLLIYRLFGAYRMQEAAVVAMLLCLLCFIMFWLIEYLVGGRKHYA